MSPRQTIRNYLLICGIYYLSASLIWGVNTLFLLDAGLDFFEVFIANAAFTVGMAAFEIPTGVVADTIGRRFSFLAGVVVLLLGTLGYVGIAFAGGGLLPFVLVSVVLGLGFTFYSGAVEAWLVDALAAGGYQGSLDAVLARGRVVEGGAMLLGTVGGGLLGNIDLAYPYLARSVLLALAFAVALGAMHDIGYQRRALVTRRIPNEMKAVFQASVEHGLRQETIRLILIVALIRGIILTWAFYAWQPYLLALLGQPDAVWVAGVVAALLALGIMVGNSLIGALSRRVAHRTTILISAFVIQVGALIGLGLSQSFALAVFFLVVSQSALSVVPPIANAFIHQLVPSSQRATMISFSSLMDSAGSAFGQVGLARLSAATSIGTGYVASGLIAATALIPALLLRRRHDGADRLDGRPAALLGDCPAPGLPGMPVSPETAAAASPPPAQPQS